jgi:hypothetical protein
MGISDTLDNALKEDIRTPLEPSETIITSYLASRYIGRQAVTCNTFLTSNRLISEVSDKVLDINEVSTVAGAAAGGAGVGAGESVMNAGIATGVSEGMNSKTRGNIIVISLADIQSLKPAKYKLFGFIPTPGKGIAISDTKGKEYKIFFGMGAKRDEWIQAIQQAKATAPASAGTGWQELA